MYYNSLERFCQMVVSNNPVLGMVIAKEDLCAVRAAFDLKDCCIAELAAIGNADELARCERWPVVACQLCRTG